MKYVRNYESFKNKRLKKTDNINEEFIGGLFKKLRDGISIGFSKMFGSSKEIDKLIENYKNELQNLLTPKIEAYINYGKLKKQTLEGGEEDEVQEKQLINKISEVSKLYNQQVAKSKEKFNIQFNEIVKREKNEKVKNYIKLKKLELEQDLLKSEMEKITAETGLTEEQMAEIDLFKNKMSETKNRLERNQKMVGEEANILKKGETEGDAEVDKFNFEEARKNPENYKWENSKYTKDYNFEKGEEIKVWMNESSNDDLSTFKKNGEDYKGTTLYVANQDNLEEDERGEKLQVSSNKEKLDEGGFGIYKSKIITTIKDEKIKEEEGGVQKPREDESQEEAI